MSGGESATQLGLGLDVKQIGEIQTYTFRFPFLPPSKNQYDSWPGQWKSSTKKKWVNHTARLADELAVPRDLIRVGLRARLVFPSNQRRDPQNYSQALWHWFPDGLVRCGVLRDDRDGMIDWGPNLGIEMAVDPRPGIGKKDRSRTIITLACRVLPERPTLDRLERG
jgi:hypothetical protein